MSCHLQQLMRKNVDPLQFFPVSPHQFHAERSPCPRKGSKKNTAILAWGVVALSVGQSKAQARARCQLLLLFGHKCQRRPSKVKQQTDKISANENSSLTATMIRVDLPHVTASGQMGGLRYASFKDGGKWCATGKAERCTIPNGVPFTRNHRSCQRVWQDPPKSQRFERSHLAVLD